MIYSQRGEGRTAALKIPHKERGRHRRAFGGGGGGGRQRGRKRRRSQCLCLCKKEKKSSISSVCVLKRHFPRDRKLTRKLRGIFFSGDFLRLSCVLPSLPSVHRSIPLLPSPPYSPFMKKMSLKTQTAGGGVQAWRGNDQ